jgi:hypothetical protein
VQSARYFLIVAAWLSSAIALAADGDLQQSPAPDTSDAGRSPSYAHASAHAPRFNDRSLWPDLSGKEYFLDEHWPAGRLYVWAHPGESGGIRGRRTPHDATDPKNWIIDGRPADALVLDEHTDLWFPASEQKYCVGFRGTDVREVCRHITIESGASFSGGGDGVGRSIYGNVWVKVGGAMDSQGATRFLGGRHTFFRNDNPHQQKYVHTSDRGNGIMSSQYFVFNKDDNRSVEFLGHVTVLDEFRIFGTQVIVGRDSILQTGRNARPHIDADSTLALLDGASFGPWANNFETPDIEIEGTLQGGLPERPLQRGCEIVLWTKNHSGARYQGPGAKSRRNEPPGYYARVPSLVLQDGARVQCYSANSEKARLQLRMGLPHHAVGVRHRFDSNEAKADHWCHRNDPYYEKRYAWFDTLPQGIDMWIAKNVTISGVTLNHLRQGGILMHDPTSSGGWEDVVFGPRCMAHRKELFSHVESLGRDRAY